VEPWLQDVPPLPDGPLGDPDAKTEQSRFLLWSLLPAIGGGICFAWLATRGLTPATTGHFEDLGIYEMVRRRCRWILVSDADADPKRGFEDLGNTVRKIWIDLGVRITFESSDLLRVCGTFGSFVTAG
jgi:hypothetical protein